MTHLRVQSRNDSEHEGTPQTDSEHEGTPQTDSLHDSSVNHALIAIAQEVAQLLRQTYPIQIDEIKQEK
ncbi:MAG: hypothetical protein CLLPBCKN_006670 [Chroococcidiopsis cubana SAG 39.79]|jgi:hypothetical protein|uniref:Uncharacterized protein n=1 Tax=Chroococcidiopsis cubana SAG 39.79 TaxID=388085 RepID=A0AB37U8U4_9CYAN|nr:hypothetical protein [Chroococcidiopsis cubana]MDZ4877235.1 hypothetical protein [Chroococcidiopsis cubana SAG 39.79]PSB49498.1 hypothetical protein C7B80_01825 [Cyanosarcina cf. burmensis CCALA 770]PSB62074.1 hypothetical protein C7B79_19550 [Chroococcidiopsis cubana CCALA 043]RUT00705.1 hypothetical protein DSM107010_67280 [Chroococcidiopsis cubana SAG 39.79]